MSDCCSTNANPRNRQVTHCPECGERGKKVDRVTLKCLLRPKALRRLEADATFAFCKTPGCPVVYFGPILFRKEDIEVPVFQKSEGGEVPVCYCFGYTRQALRRKGEAGEGEAVVEEITRLVREGKCACEFRNPQGSCCLGNVRQVLGG
ncbi:MAG: (2Fe-2S)-binding protein [Deltaproteobacteria bacterium]|nr:MAG: (2Fe-2S)-binding protein [Deltaproteobacteria bacterium]